MFVPHSLHQSNTIKINIVIHNRLYKTLGGGCIYGKVMNKYNHKAVGDTGAAVCCSPSDKIEKMGIKNFELLRSNLNLFSADKRKLNIRGCVPVKIITRRTDGTSVSTIDLLYFVDGLQKTFLSKDALIQLGSVST